MLRIPAFRQKNPWPDPELSIGESWCTIGKTQCWEAIGLAQEVAGEIFGHIKSLLESQHEHLSEGVCVPRAVLFGLYMTGRTVEKARPTIIFSCENKAQRQRAMKLVRESKLLDAYPAVLLAESSRPPRLSREPQQLCDDRSVDDAHLSDVAEPHPFSDRLVYCTHPLSRTHGIPIIIKSTDETLTFRQSTLGIVRIGDQLFGITVAHTFISPSKTDTPGKDGDMEFSLEHDSDDEDEDEEDEDFICATSRGKLSLSSVVREYIKSNEFTGSASPEQFTIDDSKSPDSSDSIPSEAWRERPADIEIRTLVSANQKAQLSEESGAKEPLRFLGRVAAVSRSTTASNLDWAVIRLECADLFSWINPETDVPLLQNVVNTLRETRKVKVFTPFNAATDGKITGTPTFMQVPHSIAFQEMWTVKLNGPLREYLNILSMIVISDCKSQNMATVDLGLSIPKMELYTVILWLGTLELLSPTSSQHIRHFTKLSKRWAPR